MSDDTWSGVIWYDHVDATLQALGEAFSSPVSALPYSIFFHFIFYFLGCQTPSKDDNLEDERLKPFLLEAKGCWVRDLEVTGGPLFFTQVSTVIIVFPF